MITDDYKKQLQQLHAKKNFKEKNMWYDDIKKFLEKETPSSIIDFGCSHGNLIQKIKTDFPSIEVVDGYDPGVTEFENKPIRTYDTLVSTDVIEHIEPKHLDETLSYIESLFNKSAWVIIACYPAKKYLPDGRNAHLTVETPDWWISKINATMPNSKIVWKEVVVKNPDKPIKDKVNGGILVPAGEQVEIRLELQK